MALDILEHPIRYRSDPSVARYAASKRYGGGRDVPRALATCYSDPETSQSPALTVDEMKALAKVLARKTASRNSGVGGPDQVAILQDGRLSAVEMPLFPVPRAERKPTSTLRRTVTTTPIQGTSPS